MIIKPINQDDDDTLRKPMKSPNDATTMSTKPIEPQYSTHQLYKISILSVMMKVTVTVSEERLLGLFQRMDGWMDALQA